MLALSVTRRNPPVKFYAYTEPQYFGELITAANVGRPPAEYCKIGAGLLLVRGGMAMVSEQA
jgi:hypothetical protein